MCNNNRCCYAFVEGLGRELITVLERQCADLQLSLHYQESRPRYQQHIHFVGALARFFLSVVHLLVSWYLFLVVHFVGILVPFPGCTHFVGIFKLVPFPGCTLCWYLGTFSWLYSLCWYLGTFSWLYTLLASWYVFLVVNLAVNVRIVF